MATPKLRFKEFEGSWLTSKIGEVFEVTSGATPLRSNKEFFKNANIPWVKTTDLNNAVITHTEEQISKIALESTSVKMLPKDTVFVAMYGGFNQIGRTGLLLNEAACNQALSAIYPNENISSFFLLSYLNHNVKEWKTFAASSRKDPNITKKDVLSFPFNYPTLKEQTKIATFLSTVDTKIDELTQKHELLTDYKKGMMQQIFSQKLRFKADDGSDFEDWDDITLGEISSKSLAKNKDESISEVLTNSATQGVIKQSDYFERDIVTTSNLKGYYVVEIGDFVYNPRISSQAPVGPIKRNKQCLGVMSPLYTVFTTNKGDINYLEYFFESSIWHDYVKSVSNSGARHDRMNIKNQDFFDMPILYPCLAEQTKIANFLTVIDQKIDNVTEQIDHAKTWKKGLLQQMFV
ncbi:restriction endonuclease subunit S [Psychrobacter sp. T6-1]|uniref:restriction endonuclease subunit S n=1 Tax=Psychrobacter sp. T6-1 TaxID=3457447 RepID=UPI003FD13C6E